MANDLAAWFERLSKSQALDVTSLLRLIALAKEHLANQPTLLDLPAPITICGDIHGQFSDLLTLMTLDIGQRILFLGDFVDRGSHSVETISFLLVRMSTFLIRGNHESRQTTSVYGFQTECDKKYNGDTRVYKAFMDVFDYLPLGTPNFVHAVLTSDYKGLLPERDVMRFGNLASVMSVDDQLEIFQQAGATTPSKLDAPVATDVVDAGYFT
ncbi:hypothetical protein DYB32_003908 [Aphanomyces invadans]|uniref:Serine/threonine-protein phosphatase n=1 Tax=Aphanomyces invadans TaxID=157072 RepID=A0A3R6Z0C8_9STRA|nr:hypothetical protein DYB32_003908 [Aphanomyces invadans]